MAARCFSVLASLLLVASSAWSGQNVVVVLDDSGSMQARMRSNRRTPKMEAAKGALIEVLRQLPPQSQVGVVRLNPRRGQPAWIVPLGPVDQTQMSSAIARVQASGGTPLGRYMKVGADALLQLRQREHYGTYRLLIVTDGEANDRSLVEAYLPDILSRGITVDVIGVDMRAAHSLATKVHSYRRADDPASLTRAIREVFAESSGGNSDTGQSDFELLAGLPDEVAAAALAALTDSGNYPIGETPPSAAGDGDAPAARTATTTGLRNAQGTVGVGAVFTLVAGLMCTGVFVVLVVVIAMVVLTRRSSRTP